MSVPHRAGPAVLTAFPSDARSDIRNALGRHFQIGAASINRPVRHEANFGKPCRSDYMLILTDPPSEIVGW